MNSPVTKTNRFTDLNKDLASCKPGKEVTIRLTSDTTLFHGYVVNQSLKIGRDDGLVKVLLKLNHPLQRLQCSVKSKVYANKSDKTIIANIFNDQNIKHSGINDVDTEHDQMVQYQCSDWDFIQQRLDASGAWLFPQQNGKLQIARPDVDRAEHKHILLGETADKYSRGIEEIELLQDCSEQPSSIHTSVWDLNNQLMTEPVQADGIRLGRGGLDPENMQGALANITWPFAWALPMNSDENDAAGAAKLLNQSIQAVRMQIMVDGSNDYQLGDRLELKDFGDQFSGSNLITEVRQHISKGYWRTSLFFGLTPDRVNTHLSASGMLGLQLGVVEDSEEKDPKDWYRIRVKVPALHQQEEALWARLSLPYASNEAGFCFHPEPGDEVVLGFFNQDSRYPVILGSMYNPKNKPPYLSDSGAIDTRRKGIQVKGENKALNLELNTEEETAKLTVDEDGLLIKDSIDMVSKGDMKVEGNNITVSGNENLDLNAKSKVSVQGAQVDLKN